MALAAGTQLGPFEITGQIGAGGMGEVYRATDSKLGREVAIKTLPASLAGDRDRLARFEREAKLLASLSHAHIASIYNLDEHEGTLYIAMELVEGETLGAKLEQGALAIDDSLQLGLQIALALEAAHERGIVHRDLKPANIMITPDGVVKVLDFGLAKALMPDPAKTSAVDSPTLSVAMTKQGLILGTAGYMSPEQASGQATDQRTDIWSFGVVLYEMLTGMPVFSGESVPHLLADVLKSEPDWSRLPEQLHPEVSRILKRCLIKKPQNRYHSIADVRIDLQDAMSNPDDSRRGPATPAVAAPLSNWRRLGVPFATFGLGLLIAASFALFVFRPEPPSTETWEHPLPPESEFSNLVNLVIAISPQGDRIAYSADGAILVRSLDSLNATRINSTVGLESSDLVFSPDGNWLAFWSAAQRRLLKVSLDGGSPQVIAAAGSDPRRLDWTSDDRIIFFQEDRFLSVSANGGEAPVVIHEGGGDGPELLPGGRYLLFNRGRNILAADTETHEEQVLFEGGLQPKFVESGHLLYFDPNTGSLLARSFDPDTLAVGGPVSMINDIYQQLSPFDAQFAVSANGTIAYIQGNPVAVVNSQPSLVITDLTGNDIEELPVPERDYVSPAVSPDGELLAIVVSEEGGSDIYLYELVGQSEMRPFVTEGTYNSAPFWKDDRTLLYTSDRDGRSRVYEQAVDGGAAVALTAPPEGMADAWPAIAAGADPDLLFTREAADQNHILMRSFAGEPEPLISHRPSQCCGTISPADDALAYVYRSIIDEGSGVFIARYPPQAAPYRSDDAGILASVQGTFAQWPAWIQPESDGAPLTLVYQTPYPLPQLVRVDVRMPTISFSNRRTIVPLDGRVFEKLYAPIPGTDQLVIIGSADIVDEENRRGAAPDRIVVIQHWFEELRRQVPP